MSTYESLSYVKWDCKCHVVFGLAQRFVSKRPQPQQVL